VLGCGSVEGDWRNPAITFIDPVVSENGRKLAKRKIASVNFAECNSVVAVLK
jgi:hypothetical protein